MAAPGVPAATGDVPMARPYGPSDGVPQRWTADSAQAGLTIPYLGPEPPPSRISGYALMGAAGVGAVFYLVRSGLYLNLAGVERTFLDQPTKARLADVNSAAQTITSLKPWVWGLLALTLGIDLIWRFQRRPKQVREKQGEAYVEFPLKWVTPIWLRIIWVVLGVGGLLASQAGAIRTTTLAADYPGHHQMMALSGLCFALLWATFALWVVLDQRSHARRLAFSAPYRQDSGQVPYFPSVAGAVTLDTSDTSSGIGWVLRTAGLAMLVIFGLILRDRGCRAAPRHGEVGPPAGSGLGHRRSGDARLRRLGRDATHDNGCRA